MVDLKELESSLPDTAQENAPPKAAAEPKKYRGSAKRGNARALGRAPKEDDSEPTSHNYTMLQAFEWESEGGGVFWDDFAKKSKALGDMGITAAWLPPPTKASSPEGNGYDVYDLWDLGEFDAKGAVRTKWGTKEQYTNAIKTAQENGIAVYVDAVLNHKAGADFTEPFNVIEVAEDDRSKEISGMYEIEGWTGFNFPGRKGKYSKMDWHHHHFTGVDWDARGEKKSIFRIVGENKGFAQGVDKENGGYDYLMYSDVDHAHPEAAQDQKDWGAWILKETGAAGFRFDAIKHIDEGFIEDFVKHIRENALNPDIFCVGEFWKDSIDSLTGYLDRFDEQFSIFDTPLHYNFSEASAKGNEYDLRSVFDGTLVQARPIDAVTLVDNHDSQPGQALESFVGAVFKPLAYALILFRDAGYPCVFVGDLYGLREPKTEPMSGLADFIRVRKLFAYGATRDYFDHANCLGWVREGDEEHDGCAIVICNGTGAGEKRMQIPDGHAGETWTDILGWSQGEITIGEDGWADFYSPAQSVAIWVKKDARGRDEFGKTA